jgi:hypothetical protein
MARHAVSVARMLDDARERLGAINYLFEQKDEPETSNLKRCDSKAQGGSD